MAYICEQTVSKYASQVECKAARSGAEGAMNELDYITPAQVAPVADIVKKMQERLKARYRLPQSNEVYSIAPFRLHECIDQIAKELLEETK